jgi:hypothetical protein
MPRALRLYQFVQLVWFCIALSLLRQFGRNVQTGTVCPFRSQPRQMPQLSELLRCWSNTPNCTFCPYLVLIGLNARVTPYAQIVRVLAVQVYLVVNEHFAPYEAYGTFARDVPVRTKCPNWARCPICPGRDRNPPIWADSTDLGGK